MFAVWLRSDGMRLVKDRKAPSLRFAIWEDGRVIRADDPRTWGSPLREGRLSPEQVTELKARMAGSGVFALKRTNAAVPDAPLHAMVVNLEGQRQILHWDEREIPNYGINISPNADDLAFMRCWKALNRAGTAVKPQGLKRAGDSFVFEPRSWMPRGS
ncbi:hypothetical protein OJ996_08420 [Luteolibacter sp. GHJ8]|uniref:Uncharacterized protein n=1 Tax=Luteolibacter rhizosphaerae TaxID=2989719 RepID=A0ABT3G175_9BACT|nr:hypothetical protein [Luteolibacter rhizosphaerae]MCW1913596.1 hypothetical protein [Luteolibacter rhizosphaerae]